LCIEAIIRVPLVEKYRAIAASHIGDDRFFVTCAEDADEAMSLHAAYDVVLLSMGARPLDGLDLIRRMRASQYGTRLTPKEFAMLELLFLRKDGWQPTPRAVAK
jgi:CheY-like chemotaxis protein